MRRIMVIPALLMQQSGLVKSVRFKNHVYVGDPINAVKIFNEKEVDELILLDISATREGRAPHFNQIKEITSEAFMPVGYGGGITSLEHIKSIISAGVEKIVLNSILFKKPSLLKEGAHWVGSQSMVASIDVKKNIWGKSRVFVRNGTVDTGRDPIDFAVEMERNGAGEILLNSISHDGTYHGYDLKLIQSVSSKVSIPVVAVGGASGMDDFAAAISHGASAVAAGSLFVYQGPHKAVLINYPDQKELTNSLFSKCS